MEPTRPLSNLFHDDEKNTCESEVVTKIIDSTYEGVYFGESSTSLRYNAATYHVLKSIVSKFNNFQILFLYIEFSKFKLDLFFRFNSIWSSCNKKKIWIPKRPRQTDFVKQKTNYERPFAIATRVRYHNLPKHQEELRSFQFGSV